MELYIVRHAIAEERDPNRWPDDAIRPLSAEGTKSFRAAARGLRRIVPSVDVVLASPHTRAWQTAEILEHDARWPSPRRCDALEAHRVPKEALDLIATGRDGASLAIVGHEPHLSQLASLFLSGDAGAVRIELKKGAVVRLTLEAGRVRSSACLRWSLSPKILRSLDH